MEATHRLSGSLQWSLMTNSCICRFNFPGTLTTFSWKKQLKFNKTCKFRKQLVSKRSDCAFFLASLYNGWVRRKARQLLINERHNSLKLFQRSRRIRQYVPDQRRRATQRYLQLCAARHLQEYLQNRYHLVPVWRPAMQDEIRQLDLRRLHGRPIYCVLVLEMHHHHFPQVNTVFIFGCFSWIW